MTSNTTPPPAARRLSIDAYRGWVMFLMMAEVLSLGRVSGALPDSRCWAFLAHHQSHVPWVGCSLHDLIQPGFTFLVGVAVPFSIAARLARGQSLGRMRLHAFWRALLLVVLGIFLRSVGQSQTNFTFEDTLTQIGLGYGLLFLLGKQSPKVQWTALGLILVGYWAAFALYPLPGADFDWAKAGIAPEWPHNLRGFAAHWNNNTNPAWAFDTWFLNLFPRKQPFTHNGGGYATLSFIPTLGTMVLGLIAGGWLRAEIPQQKKIQRLALAGVAGLALGVLLNAAGVCPNVKRIWTPTWVLFSGGWCFLFLAAFHELAEVRPWREWRALPLLLAALVCSQKVAGTVTWPGVALLLFVAALSWLALALLPDPLRRATLFPLLVIGANSITAYCIAHLWEGFVQSSLRTHLGAGFFNLPGAPYEPLFKGACVLLVLWLVLYWMHRRRMFLKI